MHQVPVTDLSVQKVHTLLFRLGGTLSLQGFYYSIDAIMLCIQQPDRLLMVTKQIDPTVAKQHHTNWQTVERNIRTFIDVAWKTNPALLIELAQRPLKTKPTPRQFIAIVSDAIIQGRAA